MSYLDAFILGFIQALTEFLPVSSSGHLVLGQALFDIEPKSGIAFEIMVHLGTLFSVIFCYRMTLRDLLLSLLPSSASKAGQSANQGWREVGLLALGCVPAGVVGVLFKSDLEQIFGSPTIVSCALIGTGIVLLLTRLTQDKGQEITVVFALLIGIAQAVAIVPGVSRAGATIAMAMLLGVPNRRGAQFSFFLSLPVILGASVLQLRELSLQDTSDGMWTLLLVASLCAFIFGVLALRLLLVLLDRGAFPKFGWYCLSVGILGLVYL